MNGGYILLIENIKDSEISIGSLGRIKFRKGFYAYTGSALNGLEARINRHLRKKKKLQWHIDYLLENARIVGIFCVKTNKRIECDIAANLSEKFMSIRRFGSSDCKCNSHLFFSENFDELISIICTNPDISDDRN